MMQGIRRGLPKFASHGTIFQRSWPKVVYKIMKAKGGLVNEPTQLLQAHSISFFFFFFQLKVVRLLSTQLIDRQSLLEAWSYYGQLWSQVCNMLWGVYHLKKLLIIFEFRVFLDYYYKKRIIRKLLLQTFPEYSRDISICLDYHGNIVIFPT